MNGTEKRPVVNSNKKGDDMLLCHLPSKRTITDKYRVYGLFPLRVQQGYHLESHKGCDMHQRGFDSDQRIF